MSTSPLDVRIDGSTAVLTLSAPERRNALSMAMRVELRAQLMALGEDDRIRALVLTGAQGHFCSGGDVSEMSAPGMPRDPVAGGRKLAILHDCIRLLAGGPKPVVAAVEGVAYGAGMSFALACDWVVAGQDARFSASFGKVGLMADCGLLWTLPRRVGEPAARDLLLTCRVLNAADAKALGMVDAVVPAGEALAAALRKCEEYSPAAPLSIAATRSVLARAPGSLNDLLAMEADLQRSLRSTSDHDEGRQAFTQKRSPVFTGR